MKYGFEIFSLSFANTVVLPFFDVIVLNVAPAQGLFTAGIFRQMGCENNQRNKELNVKP